jgi:hypothetical protein
VNVAQARVVLRPRGTGEILDLSCLIVGKHALRLYLWLGAFVLLPAYAGLLALRYLLEADWWLVWLAAFCLSSLCEGVFTIAAGRWLFAEDLQVREVLSAFSKRAFPYAFAWLSRLLLMVVSAVGLIVPAVVGTMYLFTPEASLLEMAGPLDALGRSRNFTRYNLGRAFGMWIALLILLVTVTTLVHVLCDGLIGDILQLGKPFERLEDGGSPYTLLGLLIAAPYVATARFLMYIDGRTRGDGWDIQVRFMAIEQERAEAPSKLARTLDRGERSAA